MRLLATSRARTFLAQTTAVRLTGRFLQETLGPIEVVGDHRDREIQAVVYDSRHVMSPGDMFAAVTVSSSASARSFYQFRGDESDGHRWIDAAIASGASAILCERFPQALDADVLYIKVANVVDSLARLARAVVADSRPIVIGVTGSSGKTSTCHAIACALSPHAVNLNLTRTTPITLSSSLINLRNKFGRSHPIVCEYPTDHMGCISSLAQIAKPNIAVVLNVKDAHLTAFGSLERIQTAKAELVESLGTGGVAVLNGDDQRVRAMASVVPSASRVLFFGSAPGNDFVGRVLATGPLRTHYLVRYQDKTSELSLPLLGQGSLYFVLAALAASVAAECGLEDAARELSNFQPLPGRMSWFVSENGRTRVFDNSAKSNTTNYRDLLESIQQANWTGRKILVLARWFKSEEHPSPESELWKQTADFFDDILLFTRGASQYADYIRAAASARQPAIQYADSAVALRDFVRERMATSQLCYIVVVSYKDLAVMNVVREAVSQSSV